MRRNFNLDGRCGNHLKFRDLIECSTTFKTSDISNIPRSDDSYAALEALAINILDPTIDKFKNINLTYGFASLELIRKIKKNIAPQLDQHAAHEVNNKGKFICPRLGAAVDFQVSSVSSLRVAQWLVENCPFDRLYLYDINRPLHVSFGPDHSKSIVLVSVSDKTGKRFPRNIKKEKFMELKNLSI